MSKVLVTGSAGFIGSHICQSLIDAEHEVVGLDDMSGGFRENVPRGMWCYEKSICDATFIGELFDESKFDYVIHAAAYAAEGLSHFIRRFNYDNNLTGSINLINASVKNKVKGFIFLSSIAVYGGAIPPFSELDRLQPLDPYGVAKYAVELDLHAACEMFGLPYLIFRPHNVYGERQNLGDTYRNVVGIFMNQAMRGEPLTIFGDGEQTRAFSHVGDVAPLIARMVDRAPWGETFNIGGDVPTTVNHLAELVCEIMEVPKRLVHLPPRLEAPHAHCSHAKLEQFFGAQDKMPLEVGLRLMAMWAQKRGPQTPSKFGQIEIHRNLPLSWRA